MVFFIENSRRIVATESGSASTCRRRASSPATSSGSLAASSASASGAPESMTVPEGSTKVNDSSVA